MKFKRTIDCKATIKKKKEYEFEIFTDEQIKEGKKRSFKNPLFVFTGSQYYLLYKEKGKLNIVLLHSYTIFEEIKE